MALAARKAIAPPSYYESMAHELDAIAEAIRKFPHLKEPFASRLNELARQMRDDLRLVRLISH